VIRIALLRGSDEAMVLYVDMNFFEDYKRGDGRFSHKLRFEELSGEPCLVLNYTQLSKALIEELSPKALILSGFGRSFEDYDVRSFYELNDILHETEIPTLAICGSHQLLGFLFSLNIRAIERLHDQPMRKLRPGEPDPSPTAYHPGYFKEEGFYPVTIVKDDPLFDGLSNPFWVRESHYCEVKELPPDFELLASTPECRIQAMRHCSKCLYGVQFHPEAYVEPYMDGKLILENFFKLARTKRFSSG